MSRLPSCILKGLLGSSIDKLQQTEATCFFAWFKIYMSLCFCRLCTQARRRAGRSTARHKTQMGSVSVPWLHQPRTCVTATHAADSFASSWRRWQLSITHSHCIAHTDTNINDTTLRSIVSSAVCHIQAAGVCSLTYLIPQLISNADEYNANQKELFVELIFSEQQRCWKWISMNSLNKRNVLNAPMKLNLLSLGL